MVSGLFCGTFFLLFISFFYKLNFIVMPDKDYTLQVLTKDMIAKLKGGCTFRLLTYSNPNNKLKIDESDVFQGRYNIVDQTRLVVVAIAVDFLEVGIICQTPFPTDFITFSIAANSIMIE